MRRTSSTALIRRRFVTAVLPPIVLDALRFVRSRFRPPPWEAVPPGWQRPVRGWNVAGVADAERRRWPDYERFVAGARPFGVSDVERPSDSDLLWHNIYASHAYVLALAAGGRPRLSILDWGGNVGQLSLLADAVLPDLELAYHVRDLPAICAVGRELRPTATFFEDDACFDNRYDLVVASSALQYVEDWRSTLRRLADAADDYLYLTRVPVARDRSAFVALQRAYKTEYLGWVFSRSEVLAAAEEAGLTLAREFLCGERHHVARGGGWFDTRGFLFSVL